MTNYNINNQFVFIMSIIFKIYLSTKISKFKLTIKDNGEFKDFL
jgi:hypothetical protein